MAPQDEDTAQQRYVRRQLSTQRKNLSKVCRLAIKSLVDKSCFEEIDDSNEELVNFCAITEEILNHRLKPSFSWLNKAEPQFWEYVRIACKEVPNNCLRNIERMENIKSPKAKGRAWLRMVLMEKRLSEYISFAMQQTNFTKSMYREGAIILSEEMTILTGSFLSLNAIDFSLCLKGEDLEIGHCYTINYSSYLHFKQSAEGDYSDERELNELNGFEHIHVDDENSWKSKYHKLESLYKTTCEQKGYLEELVRLRESQHQDILQQRDSTRMTLHQLEAESYKERQQLEGVILELQGQLSSVKDDYHNFQKRVESYFRAQESSQDDGIEAKQQNSMFQESDWQSISSSEGQLPSDSKRHHLDSRSIYSTTSGMSVQLKDDTTSMAPLYGSISSQTSLVSGDSNINKTGDRPITLGSSSSSANHNMSANQESAEKDTLKSGSNQMAGIENEVFPGVDVVSELQSAIEDTNHGETGLHVDLGRIRTSDKESDSSDHDFEVLTPEATDNADKLSWDNFGLDADGNQVAHTDHPGDALENVESSQETERLPNISQNISSDEQTATGIQNLTSDEGITTNQMTDVGDSSDTMHHLLDTVEEENTDQGSDIVHGQD